MVYTFCFKDFFCIGFPQRVRLDKGTENTLIAQCQIALSMCQLSEQDSARSVQYGSSPTNSVSMQDVTLMEQCIRLLCLQRIESWWSWLRKQKTDWWIEHFRVSNAHFYTQIHDLPLYRP